MHRFEMHGWSIRQIRNRGMLFGLSPTCNGFVVKRSANVIIECCICHDLFVSSLSKPSPVSAYIVYLK